MFAVTRVDTLMRIPSQLNLSWFVRVNGALLISDITSIQRLPTVHGQRDMLGIMVKVEITLEHMINRPQIEFDTSLCTVLQNIYVVGGCISLSKQHSGEGTVKFNMSNIVVT